MKLKNKLSFSANRFLLTALLMLAGTEQIHAASTKSKKQEQPAASLTYNGIKFTELTEVKEFIQEMRQKHRWSESELFALFQQTVHLEKVRQLIKPAPAGKPKNWQAYRSRFIESARIGKGLQFWEQNEAVLLRAQNDFGIPPEIIVGLIGIETMYGKNTGSFRAIDALTTLAFDYPETANREARMRFFRDELEALLVIAHNSGSDAMAYKGSYAGALGLPQFMPGSILRYAVDYDGDGKIDLGSSTADAIGSVASYLAKHGWKKNLPVAYPATLLVPADHPSVKEALERGLKATLSYEQLSAFAGVSASDLPVHISYGLIDLQNGSAPDEFWIGTDNFFAITYYNRSYFYAMSVFELGRIIKITREK